MVCALIELIKLRKHADRNLSRRAHFHLSFNRSHFVVETNDLRSHHPIVRLRKRLEDRIKQHPQRNKDDKHAANQCCDPEWQKIMQKRFARLVEPACFVAQRYIDRLRGRESTWPVKNARL